VVTQAVNDLRYRFLVENTTDYAIFTMDLDGRIETGTPAPNGCWVIRRMR
jgi:hypothetical protein